MAEADDEKPDAYRYAVPESTGDGWEAASLAQAGLDPAPIRELFGRIADETYENIHGVVLARDGKLVVEAYFPGTDALGERREFGRDTLHSLQSATKSVNALLIGIAIERKLIGGVEEPLSRSFPDHADLFAPLGIADHRWGKLPDGTVHTGGGLWLRPRDMAKLGQVTLDGGRWRGGQVVGEAWVRDSVRQQAPYRGYGYQWWLRTFWGRDRAIASQGLGGQFIVVIPELRLVATFTGWNVGERTEQPFEILQRYVVPAVNAS